MTNEKLKLKEQEEILYMLVWLFFIDSSIMSICLFII